MSQANSPCCFAGIANCLLSKYYQLIYSVFLYFMCLYDGNGRQQLKAWICDSVLLQDLSPAMNWRFVHIRSGRLVCLDYMAKNFSDSEPNQFNRYSRLCLPSGVDPRVTPTFHRISKPGHAPKLRHLAQGYQTVCVMYAI